jgi:hypothetical protein
MIETDLYFGQTRPDGSMITAQEWNQFKETHICRIFKEGSSTFSVVGNWFDPDAKKLITEPSYMVSHLHKKSELISKQIDSLRTLYKTLFQQQSVLRVDRKVKASF